MAAIASAAAIAAKWARVTPTRAADYQAGIESPRRDWQKNTAAAKGAYEAGVTEAIAQDRFTKGVNKAGNSTWQRGALEKGVPRWGQGVQLAESAYEKGFAPYREAIDKLALPPRFARRDPRNLARVAAVTTALAKVKTSIG